MSQGLPDLRRLPLDRFCNFIWWWLTRNASSNVDVEKVRLALWRPPPGTRPDPRGPWGAEAEKSAFAALKAGFGGGARPAKENAPVANI